MAEKRTRKRSLFCFKIEDVAKLSPTSLCPGQCERSFASTELLIEHLLKYPYDCGAYVKQLLQSAELNEAKEAASDDVLSSPVNKTARTGPDPGSATKQTSPRNPNQAKKKKFKKMKKGNANARKRLSFAEAPEPAAAANVDQTVAPPPVPPSDAPAAASSSSLSPTTVSAGGRLDISSPDDVSLGTAAADPPCVPAPQPAAAVPEVPGDDEQPASATSRRPRSPRHPAPPVQLYRPESHIHATSEAKLRQQNASTICWRLVDRKDIPAAEPVTTMVNGVEHTVAKKIPCPFVVRHEGPSASAIVCGRLLSLYQRRKRGVGEFTFALSPSSMSTHLKSAHAEAWDAMAKLVAQERANETADRLDLTTASVSADEQAIFEELLASYVASAGLPYSVVENREFRRMMSFVGGVQVISATTLKERMASLYHRVVALYSAMIAGEDVSITSDMWTSGRRGTGDHYCSLTLHWINGEGLLNHLVAGAYHLEGQATGQRIEVALQEMLGRYGRTPGEVHAIASDRGSNIIRASTLAGIERASCTCHLLDTVVKDSLRDPSSEAMLKTLETMRTIVKAINGSSTLRDIFAESQAKVGLGPELSNGNKLLLTAKTRWSSHYRVVCLFLANREAIMQTLTSMHIKRQVHDDLYKRCMNSVDVHLLYDFALLTAPVTLVTTYAQGANYVTSSASIPLVSTIAGHLAKLIAHWKKTRLSDGKLNPAEVDAVAGDKLTTAAGLQYAVNLQAALSRRFHGGHHIEDCRLFGFPTLLDPAYGEKVWTSKEKRASMVSALRTEIARLERLQLPPDVDNGELDHDELARQVHLDPALALLDDAVPSAAPSVGRPRKASEWDMYLEEAAEHRLVLNDATRTFAIGVNSAKHSQLLFAHDGDDAGVPEVRFERRGELLHWWRDRRHKLPILFSIFRRFAAMPAGGGPSESQFSTMGHLLSSRRMSTSPKHAQQLTIVKCFFMRLPRNQTLESLEVKHGIRESLPAHLTMADEVLNRIEECEDWVHVDEHGRVDWDTEFDLNPTTDGGQ